MRGAWWWALALTLAVGCKAEQVSAPVRGLADFNAAVASAVADTVAAMQKRDSVHRLAQRMDLDTLERDRTSPQYVKRAIARMRVREDALLVLPEVPQGPPPPAGVSVPATIAADCSADVTAPLGAWIASVPDNTTLRFAPSACYLIDQGLILDDRVGLTFDGNGATFLRRTKLGRDNANFRLRGGGSYTFRNLTIKGAHPNGGLSETAWVPETEGQHGLRFEGTQGALVDSVTITDVYGDFVEAEPDWRVAFPGEPTRNITVRRAHFDRNGRMGVGLSHVDGFTLEDSYIGNVRWSAIDVELDDHREVGKNIVIQRNRFGPMYHMMFSNISAGNTGDVGPVTIRGNVMEAHPKTCLYQIWTMPHDPAAYWSGWTIEGNTFRVMYRGVAIQTNRARDVRIDGNAVIGGPPSDGGCAEQGAFWFKDSHTGVVSNNTLRSPYPGTHTIDALSTGFTFTNNLVVP